MSEQVNLRNLVLDILLAVEQDAEFSHIAIRNVLDKYGYLPHRDRAFIKRLASGTLERQLELDYILNQFSKTKTKKMKPVIRILLRMALYQMLYMDSVPDAAAVNEAVRLAKKRGFSGLSGYVNGVLRGVLRKKESISYPSMETDPVLSLSVRYSVPDWIVARFVECYGAARCEAILQSYLKKQTTCVRVNVYDCDMPQDVYLEKVKEELRAQNIQLTADARLPYALFIDGYESLTDLALFQKGVLYVQDVSSMMVAEAAKPKPGAVVLDVCAAPGGKSIHVAQMLKGSGLVEARDVSDYKVSLIRENMERCQTKNMRAVVMDARCPDPEWKEKADLVLADLPCSGLGVIGNKTDIKYRISEEKIAALASLQRELLSVVKEYVKPGGVLLYSTCTMTKEENEENCAWFLKENPSFALLEEHVLLPDEGCDGFYIAKLQRQA